LDTFIENNAKSSISDYNTRKDVSKDVQKPQFYAYHQKFLKKEKARIFGMMRA
jgi:hypothetical protein